MIRTNPAKGLGVEPRWKQIGWEEAIAIVAERVRDLWKGSGGREGEVIWASFDYWGSPRTRSVETAFMSVLGGLFMPLAADCFCGNAVHPPSYLNTASFEITPDAEYARYFLLIGAQAGSIIHYDTMNVARHIAEKRPGSVKVTVVDPVCSYAASKAEEWIPIRPGTDAAFLLCMVNLLVNEYKVYDDKFLKQKTNAPYLIQGDGVYLRDPETHKPLVWDSDHRRAKPFDSDVGDFALEGTFRVDGEDCKPAFQLLKEHATKYSPRYVSEVTTIPSETLKRIARELGEAASIGSTITVDGVEMPHRPVAVVWYRGLSAHRHSYLAGLAAMLLATLLGSVQVPGGIKGEHPVAETVSTDGLLTAQSHESKGAPYPPRPVVKPSRIDLYELFPVAVYSNPMMLPMLLEPEKFGVDPDQLVKPKMMFVYKNNPVKNTVSPEYAAEALKRIPFIVTFDLEPNETTQLADVVFPDLHYLERLAEGMFSGVDEPGYWYAPKPAVHPPFGAPHDRMVSIGQVFLAIAERAGIISEIYRTLNRLWRLVGTPYELKPESRYDYAELIGRRLKVSLGPDRGLDWLLSKEGGLIVGKATPQELYRGAFRTARLHVYFEFMLGAGKAVQTVTSGLGLPWDTSDYQALPDWKPCLSFSRKSDEYDLFVVNYKVPVQAHGLSRTQPILRQLGGARGHDYALIHVDTGRRKGLRDGDEIYIQTVKGSRIKTRVRFSGRVHPEVIATTQHKLSGTEDFNALLNLDKETVDFVGCAVDSCLLAKVSKA